MRKLRMLLVRTALITTRCWSFIVHLFPPCGPTAIFRRIVAIVIDAVKTQTRSWFSHICIKILKAMPLFTDFYSTTPIVLVSRIRTIFTPLNHGRPNPINLRSRHTMCRFLFDVKLPFKTTARSGCSAREALSKNNPFFSAITLAKILNLIMPIVLNPIQNRDTIKPFSRQINLLHSIYSITNFSPCQGDFV